MIQCYPAQGLQLFHRGKQLIGTKLSEFCAFALLALEVLMHPRALPLVHYSAIHNSFGEVHSDLRDGYDDDSCQKWLDDGTEQDVPLAKEGTKQPERNEKMPETATCVDIVMKAVEDDNVNKSGRPGESAMPLQDPISCTRISQAEASGGSVVVEPVSEKIVSDSIVPHSGNQMGSSQETSISKDRESAYYLSNKMPMTSDLNKDQRFAPTSDQDDSSDDDLPNIVDADPDSASS
ncbi:hypothetical protein K1719_019649 [Acacia pycnantha]|nr:hypothetical protein K1719_019649 [Acacia pycnantha]